MLYPNLIMLNCLKLKHKFGLRFLIYLWTPNVEKNINLMIKGKIRYSE